MIKLDILRRLELMRNYNRKYNSFLRESVSLAKYKSMVRREKGMEIWTDALQAAIMDYEIVVIPAREKPYYIDRTVIIGSNRRIEAYGARLVLTPDCKTLMFRSDHTMDGTHTPIGDPDFQTSGIFICGGRYEESNRARAGYGETGKYDDERSFYGVSALFFFNNISELTITDVTFAHAAGFAVQIGDASDVVLEHIRFESCYADGLHINGNTKRLICRDIRGQVGDDLVALNAYDWQNSSVDFGPISLVLVEDLELSGDSPYKALRIEPGRYYYDDGSEVDCSLKDIVISKVQGIRTFKLYYQTPAYRLGNAPERGDVGSGDRIYFDHINVDLTAPLDRFDEYLHSDPVKGSFGAFELGANIGHIWFDHIDLTLDRETYPYSCLAVVGPKSVRVRDLELFDPYLSSTIGQMTLSNIRLNGEPVTDEQTLRSLVREVSFDDVNGDGQSTASGHVGELILK